jgi:hypothetical protein
MIKKILDILIVPLIIIALLYDPNFMHGRIDTLEAGQYLTWANSILDGKIPYKDFFILFGIFQIYAISASLAIFGKALIVLRTFFYINYILMFLAVYALAMKVLKKRLFIYIATFICIVETSQPFWAARWDYGRMGLGILLLLLALIMLESHGRRPALFFIIGTLSAFVLFYSMDIGIFSIFSFSLAYLSLYCEKEKRDLKYVFRDGVPYTAGLITIIIPFAAYMWTKGALSDFLRIAFYIIPKYHMAVWSHPVPCLSEAFTQCGNFWLFPQSEIFKCYLPAIGYSVILAYLCIMLLKNRWKSEQTRILLLTAFGSLTYAASFRSLTGPQFLVTLPVFIILVAMFLEKAQIKRYFTYPAIILIVITFFIVSPKRFYGTLEGWGAYQVSKSDRVALYNAPAWISASDLETSSIPRIGHIMIPRSQEKLFKDVANYLSQNTIQGEEIFFFPEQGIFAFCADRPYATRFSIAGFAWTAPWWREEILRDLSIKRPRIIVWGKTLSNMARSISRKEELLPTVIGYIEENYSQVAKFDYISIYKRNDAGDLPIKPLKAL